MNGVEAPSVNEGELMNVQVLMDPETEHIQIRLADGVFKFHQEDKETMVQGFAVKSLDDLPDSIDLSEKQELHILDDQGNVYVQADVLELAEHSDYVDAVEHRFRTGDSKSFHRRDEEDGDRDGS